MKALLFDACDILYHRPREASAVIGFFGPEAARIRREKALEFKQLQTRTAMGEASLQAMYDGMLALYGWPEARASEGHAFLTSLMADVEYFDGVAETLHALRARGVKLAIVTNSFQSSATKLGWFAHGGIADVWDAFVSSSEIGLMKPAPAIFQAALDRLDCEAAEAGFVAHAANELDGAKEFGLTTIAFNRDNETVRADYIISHFSQLLDIAG